MVISIVVNFIDEAMMAETRIQLRKSYYVTVVFLAQVRYCLQLAYPTRIGTGTLISQTHPIKTFTDNTHSYFS